MRILNRIILPVFLFALLSFAPNYEGAAVSSSKGSLVINLSDASFDSVVSKGLVVVDFWATWCHPCIKQGPVIEALANDFKEKVVFGKLDIDRNRATARRFVVRSIPTLILFKDGKAVERIIGLTKKKELKKIIKKYL